MSKELWSLTYKPVTKLTQEDLRKARERAFKRAEECLLRVRERSSFYRLK